MLSIRPERKDDYERIYEVNILEVGPLITYSLSLLSNFPCACSKTSGVKPAL